MALYKSLVKKISVRPEQKVKQKDYQESGVFPIVDQGKEKIGGYSNDEGKVIKCNLPVIVFGDHTRAVKYIDFQFIAGADGIKVIQPNASVLPSFLYYGTQYIVAKMPDRGYARHYQYLEKEDLEIPGINEQRRIVSRIEELFSELDNSVSTLQKTKEQLAVYRQAVLKEAFDSIKADSVCIQDVCEKIIDCPHSTPKWTRDGYLCLRTTNFRRGYLDLSEPNYVSKDTFDTRNQRLIPMPGDVLYSREGAILGLACIIPSDTYVCLGQRMMLLRSGSKLSNMYLMHFLNSPRLTNFVASVTGGSASPHVNVGDIKKFQMPFPDIEEQNRIVGFIESRLSVCDSIERTIDTALQQAEAMRQSILKQAFEGRL